jgi:hypothetical protein
MLRSTPALTLPLAAAIVLMLAGRAEAQTPTLPTGAIGPCALPLLEPPSAGAAGTVGTLRPTSALTRSFQSGDWAQLKADVKAVIDGLDARRDLTPDCAVPSPSPAFVVVAWVGGTALGESALLAAVVPLGRGEAYAARLPGVSGANDGLYQLFVSDGETDALAAGYLSTPLEDPLVAQVPDVAASVLAPALALASRNASRALRGKASPAGTERAPAPAAGWATIARVDLPHERAKVKVAMQASLAPSSEGLASASEALRDKLALVDVRYSALGRAFAGTLDGIVRRRAGQCVASPDTCLSMLDRDFRREYDEVCPCPDEDRKAVQLVDGKFRALLLDLEGQSLEAALTLQNTPLRHTSFGVLTGVSFARTSKHPNVTVDRGVYAHDGLDRQIAMVTVNRSFEAYDEKTVRITRAERHRWFVGAVVTPTFGVGAGYSYLPIRGLGVNVGYAVLGTSRPSGGRTVGEAPADEDDPYALGWAGTWVFGLSYNFK